VPPPLWPLEDSCELEEASLHRLMFKAALDVAAANAKLRTRCASPSLASRGLV
jgi:hypothetical protein